MNGSIIDKTAARRITKELKKVEENFENNNTKK